MRPHGLEGKSFLVLLALVSAAFVWVVFPLSGGVLWAVCFAILFDPLNRRLARPLRPTWAALSTTALVLLLVILPGVLIAGFIVQQGTALWQRVGSGEIDLAAHYRAAVALLPGWISGLLDGAGLSDLPALQETLKQSAALGTRPIASRVWLFGQDTLDFSVSFFVMLYLLFFLLRDGDAVLRQIRRALPLGPEVQQRLFRNFAGVIRSTVKGNVAIAAIQGALGGAAFMLLGIPGALLWAVMMAFLSLLPTIGAALVWAPVAGYLLLTGQVWQGVALVVFGVVVIGLVDNVLRPVLVGKEARMPDYLVLISTIGGMSLFGINGFVIGPVVAAMFIAAWELAALDAPDLDA